MSNYTWSKALDYESLDRNSTLPQNPFDMRPNTAPADFDRRHVFVTSSPVRIPHPVAEGHPWSAHPRLADQRHLPLCERQSADHRAGTDRALQGGGNQRVDVVGNPVLDPAAP